jgi:fumarylacetoacetate (FAA) hydrolase
MTLASKRNDPDGALLVVSKDAKTAVSAGDVAPTIQAALDDWDLR